MKFTSIIAIIAFSINLAFSQSTIDITFKDYDQDYVVIGYYYGDRQLVLDTVVRNDQDQFLYENAENLSTGVYLLLLSPNNRYIQFLVNEKEQNFSIELDNLDLGKPIIKGSADNQTFLDYVTFLNKKGTENEALLSKINAKKELNESTETLQQERKNIDLEVKAYQNRILQEHPKTVTATLISSTKDVVIPEFNGSEEEIKLKQYKYYKEHYFDHIDLANPVYIRTPFLHNKIDSYLNKLTSQVPDSLMVAIDYVLGKMNPSGETYKFYLSYFLNTYAGSKVVGQDAIYVHLVDKYYAAGKADWVEEENLVKIVTEANKIRPTLIGKLAQDITVFRKDSTPISISDIDSKYLILYFWAPDCGHCKKATPHMIEFYKKYRESSNIEILAVCTKHRDKEPACWDSVEEKGMDLWINASDTYHLSNFRAKYNVEQTPAIFILNENREIIMKRIGAEHLDEIMSEIIRIDDEEAMRKQMK